MSMLVRTLSSVLLLSIAVGAIACGSVEIEEAAQVASTRVPTPTPVADVQSMPTPTAMTTAPDPTSKPSTSAHDASSELSVSLTSDQDMPFPYDTVVLTAHVDGVPDGADVRYAWEELVDGDWVVLVNETSTLSIESEEIDIRRYKVTVEADGAMATAELDVIWGETGIYFEVWGALEDKLEVEDSYVEAETNMLKCIKEVAASNPDIDLDNRPPIDEVYLGGYRGAMVAVIDGCDAETGYFAAVHEAVSSNIAELREANPLYDEWMNTEFGALYALQTGAPKYVKETLGIVAEQWELEHGAGAAE